ncbi:GTP-binding protein EngB [Labilithrix luteola]|uniref:Probable GTP-binding protein EngB n=1 Tax=Labilithrix luteola TaxID=1391654 RepID=A0A0K1Q7E7_9BACT|nr:ribosome biogenesis GTP-binding protein YihA/YsxC [Labilithrix luteola]AKV01654.1 GTP-binding protein EngB [Labilithrix luteola]
MASTPKDRAKQHAKNAARNAAAVNASKNAGKRASDSGDAKNEFRVQSAEFSAGAAAGNQIPEARHVEIAFAGRSNVGKSSLLNMMVQRKSLARTSRTPGRTRQINFFDVSLVGGPTFVFVDLPGYGYAKVSKTEARDWKVLLEDYLQGRTTLRAVVILVDARRGLEQEELDLIEFLQTRPEIQIVMCATKLDKLPLAAQKPRLQELSKDAAVKVIGTSAESGGGRVELWKRLVWIASGEDQSSS